LVKDIRLGGMRSSNFGQTADRELATLWTVWFADSEVTAKTMFLGKVALPVDSIPQDHRLSIGGATGSRTYRLWSRCGQRGQWPDSIGKQRIAKLTDMDFSERTASVAAVLLNGFSSLVRKYFNSSLNIGKAQWV